ncbi:biotin transporter BioY [Lachnospiraceae bacterium 38-10]
MNAKIRTYDMAYIAVFTVLIAICSWISIPTAIPFTLQTFAIFLSVSVLGGKRGTMAVLLYVLLGAIGLPVFSGFTGGIGIIMNTTGGYIIGFILSALIMWLMESIFGKKLMVQALAMVLGLFTCYAAGTMWFMSVYMKSTGPIGLTTVLGWCVVPFIIPDTIKITLALTLSKALRGPLSKIIDEPQA